MAKTKNLLFGILAALMMTGSVIITGCSSSDLPAYTYGLNYEHSGTVFVPAVQQDFNYTIKLEHNVVTLNFMGLDFSFPLYNAATGESRLCVGCGDNTDGTKGVFIHVGNDKLIIPLESAKGDSKKIEENLPHYEKIPGTLRNIPENNVEK